MIWETSSLDANAGIRFRGFYHWVEGIITWNQWCYGTITRRFIWLMIAGDSTEEDVRWLSQEWQRRSKPACMCDPLTISVRLLITSNDPVKHGILAMQPIRCLPVWVRYEKTDYWDIMYEDVDRTVLPRLLACIYLEESVFIIISKFRQETDLIGWNFTLHAQLSTIRSLWILMRLYMTTSTQTTRKCMQIIAVHLVTHTGQLDTRCNTCSGPGQECRCIGRTTAQF